VFACVPKSGNIFQITAADNITAELLLDGLDIAGRAYDCCEVVHTLNRPVLVSIMHLPAYIEDDVITTKIMDLDSDIQFASPIRRHYYRGTSVADGTRIVTLRLSPKPRSLPYTMTFPYGDSSDYYRVIDNNQVKLCRICNSDCHLMQDCPHFLCHKRVLQGHMKRRCVTLACDRIVATNTG
jgi:hypothetical protein